MRFFLLIILFFILFRVAGLVIRMIVGRPSTRNVNQNTKPPGANVNVKKDSSKSAEGYKGGEYIDFEDVD